MDTFTSTLLKEGLEELGLSSSGKKSDRYQRLLNALSSNEEEAPEEEEEDQQDISKYTQKLDQLFWLETTVPYKVLRF